MEKLLPNNVIHLSSIETEVESGISFDVLDEYYLISITQTNFNWANFRLSWDDNWERWFGIPTDEIYFKKQKVD